MKYWTICYPGELGQHVQETFSEDQIIESYYSYWANRCLNALVDSKEINKENCIRDWCTVHWAWETDEFGKALNA